jgi:hypothetical protein
MRHLEVIVEASAAELASALWYLKQRGLAASDDKSSLQITVDGMDFLETRKPLPEEILAFIKPSGLAAAAPTTPTAQSKRAGESVMSTLNRALARTSA